MTPTISGNYYDKPEILTFWAVCIDRECDWVSEGHASADECENACTQCAGEVEVEKDYV